MLFILAVLALFHLSLCKSACRPKLTVNCRCCRISFVYRRVRHNLKDWLIGAPCIPYTEDDGEIATSKNENKRHLFPITREGAVENKKKREKKKTMI